MKQSNGWSFYLVSSGSIKVRRIKVPGLTLALFALCMGAGIVGFVMSVFYVGVYGYTRVGLYNAQIENGELKEKLRFLDKLADDYSAKIQRLVVFEDKSRLKYGMNTISEDIRLAGVGGRPSLDQMVADWLEDPDVRKADHLEMKFTTLLRQVNLQDSSFSRMVNHVVMQHDRWKQLPSIWPCRGRITSSFGYRYHPMLGGMIFHEGIDIANEMWTPIFATADGIVSSVGYRGNYGTSVFLSHRGSGYTTVYAHLVQARVVEGQVLKRGELVGYLGNSGRSTGPHLHYEVRNNDKFENPMKYILPMDIVVD